MTFKTALLRSAALGASAAMLMGATAQAATTTKHHKHTKVVHKTVVVEQNSSEIRALRSEVEELKARLDAQSQAQQATAAQVAQTQTQVQEAAASAASAQDKVETIPEQVNVAVGQIPKPKTDKLYVKGVSITLGGFIEAAMIGRSHNESSDIASSYANIPYSGPGATTTASPGAGPSVGHTQELRFSARQSRISALIEGDPDSNTHLSAYSELDFQGAAQTANSNESNSYNLRIRNLYLTMDRSDLGLHLLAGQNWSLVTLNGKGISPRNEIIPPSIDAQYIPGFAWARQPQIRVTEQLTPEIWVAASAENPQTTFYAGANALPAAVRAVYNQAGGSGFNSANNLSLNHIPDIVAKAAYEPTILDRPVHLEVFGLFRAFYDREASGIIYTPPVAPATAGTLKSSATGDVNQNVYGGGAGFGATVAIIPKMIDFQVSGLMGKGIGRYGTGQLSDVTFKYNGQINPIEEAILLAGVTYHVDSKLDVYAFGGGEQASRNTSTYNGTAYGYGNGLYSNVGCLGESATGTCVGNTHSIEQATGGFWWKAYNGPMGQMRVGLQYSYTERKAFPGVGGVPSGNENMIFTSLRYYPFQ